jgi:predicted Zn-dependent peptidase
VTAAVHRLANGVRVVCDPMPSLESVALSVVIRGGARWESQATNGWSHLLEHMVFKGAGARSAKDIVEAVEGGGGHINAATGYERTSFQVRCLPEGLPLAMQVLADLVRRPTLDAGDLEREIQVIGQEIAEAADTPDDRVFDLAQSAFFAGQSLGRPILGAVERIGAATVETLRAFHAGLYAADRLVVSAAGAVDEARLLKLAEAAFGDAGAPSAPLPEPAPAAFHGGAAVEARRLEQAQLVVLLPGVAARDPDYFAMRLFAEILGGGMSSRLFQEVRENRGLAYAIDAYAEHYEDTGVVGVYAGAAAGDTAETAALTAREIGRLAARVEPVELARAKAQAKAGLFMGREAPLNRAEQAAGQLFLFDRLIPPAELAAGVDAVTAADIARCGTRVLSGPRTVAVLGPKSAGGAVKAFEKAL